MSFYLKNAVRFDPIEKLVSTDNFRVFEKGFVHSNFKTISNKFLSDAIVVDCENPNEKNELEFQRVHKINIQHIQQNDPFWYLSTCSLSPTLQVIDNINVLCFDAEKKRLGFHYFNYFLKSIIAYGLPSEKLHGLYSLNKFLTLDDVRNELRQDEEFERILKEILMNNQSENDQEIIQRLNALIQSTLNLIAQ